MALPLIPIAVAALAGGGATAAVSSLFGGKKGDTTTYAPQTSDVYHQPYETYQPVQMYAPQQQITMPQYQVSIGSEGSQSMSTKQDAKQTTSQQPSWRQPTTYPTQSSSAGSSGLDTSSMMLIALIAAGGLIAYGVIK